MRNEEFPTAFDLNNLIILPVSFSQTAICFSEIVPCLENIFSSLAINRSNKIYSKSQLFRCSLHSYFANKIFQATQKNSITKMLCMQIIFLHFPLPRISKHKKVNTLCYWHFIQPTSDSKTCKMCAENVSDYIVVYSTDFHCENSHILVWNFEFHKGSNVI